MQSIAKRSRAEGWILTQFKYLALSVEKEMKNHDIHVCMYACMYLKVYVLKNVMKWTRTYTQFLTLEYHDSLFSLYFHLCMCMQYAHTHTQIQLLWDGSDGVESRKVKRKKSKSQEKGGGVLNKMRGKKDYYSLLCECTWVDLHTQVYRNVCVFLCIYSPRTSEFWILYDKNENMYDRKRERKKERL